MKWIFEVLVFFLIMTLYLAFMLMAVFLLPLKVPFIKKKVLEYISHDNSENDK